MSASAILTSDTRLVLADSKPERKEASAETESSSSESREIGADLCSGLRLKTSVIEIFKSFQINLSELLSDSFVHINIL